MGVKAHMDLHFTPESGCLIQVMSDGISSQSLAAAAQVATVVLATA
jgi:hypothetical protein